MAPATLFIIPTFLLVMISVTSMSLLLPAGEAIPSTLDGPFEPLTRRFDPSLRRGSDDLPIDHPRLRKRNVSSDFPEQIALALSTPTSMWVSWVTGNSDFTIVFQFDFTRIRLIYDNFVYINITCSRI